VYVLLNSDLFLDHEQIICKSCFYVFFAANLFVSKLSLDSIWCSSDIALSAGQWLLLPNCIWVIQIWMCSEYSWGSGLAESIGYVSTLFLCILVSWISAWPVSRFWSSFINIFIVPATRFQFKTASIFSFVCYITILVSMISLMSGVFDMFLQLHFCLDCIGKFIHLDHICVYWPWP